ncbi:MAG: Ig domain-containing protein [Lachnospiraceae bacterium]|nr:Ig domain-containing protein [Lachnospiraceae bacterium]
MKKNSVNRKRSIKSITALLLSCLLLFQTNIAFATAGIVSENDPAGEEAISIVSENRPSESEESEAGAESEEKLEDMEESPSEEEEATVSGQSLPEIQAGAVTGPANPVHHCAKENDGSDYTDFSYVYFGSYPQSEVTDSVTIAAIDNAIEKYGIEADAGMDVWVNGMKYRRISKNDTNYDGYFYDMPISNGYRYFKWERIKWRVLQNDGSTLLVVADKVIDCKDYNEEYADITWGTSTIRNWLNTSFYNTAFSSNEQSAVKIQNVVNEDNPFHGTEGGNNTNDNIYLLSISEVTNAAYGFCSDYSTDSASRWAQPSSYAHARGTYTYNSSSTGGNDNCWWWLRSPGPDSVYAAYVADYGYVTQNGSRVNRNNDGVRPALRINLSSDVWFMTDDGTSGDGGVENQAAKEKTITKLSIQAPSKKLAAGKKVKLTLKVTPEDAANKSVKWGTSNKKYATVDKNGELTLKKAGIGKEVTITATAQDGSGKNAVIKIKIMKHAVKTITLKAPKNTIKTGKSMTIKSAVKTTGNSANKSLKWTSSNKKYATVNSKGKVTAKKAGKGKTVTITATSTDGSNKKAKVKIKIK